MVFSENSKFLMIPLASDQCLWIKGPEEVQDLLALAWKGRRAVADWEDARLEPELTALEKALGPQLLVSERWQQALPQAGVLIPAALSGGVLAQRLREAAEAAPGRCWLRLEPVRMRFPLPCPTGCGQALSQPALEAKLKGKRTFFSEALCCRYAYDLDSGTAMLLYDTDETLEQKLRLARDSGFTGAVLWS